MLKNWRSHSNYKIFLISNLKNILYYSKSKIIQLSKIISKLYILNLDPLENLISSQYSFTGRPAVNQPEIMRSFVLMNSLGVYSITDWVKELRSTPLYCYIIGVHPDNVPSIGAHYAFINRSWLANDTYDKPKLFNPQRKPKKKYKKGEKKPPKKSGIVQKIVNQVANGRTLKRRPERLFQKIFSTISIKPSVSLGLLGNTQKLSISGDGTCIETGASSYGIKVCDCRSKDIYDCKCKRQFSDPNATWGWDSYHEKWFYGYTGFLFSAYNKSLKLDLPIFIRILEARRHDSVSAVIGLAELKELYPNFKFKYFIGDSAFDNKPTYQLLDIWNISAIIALNKRAEANYQYYQPELNNSGIPICQAGNKMTPNGSCPGRNRYKWRCALASKKIKSCPFKNQCSPSEYGRTFYTKFSNDLRLFPTVPRGTKKWKALMKTRTTSERINKRILNDYGIEKTKARGKKRWSWWSMIASTNIHLDAQIKHGKFDFIIDPIKLIENNLVA